ncbi:hypothetical protein FRB95_003851 [Tulasnella sp. JGI-2019a]|nr:hypothetical protein FRB95_003851 [Tulasnella sp. JGI-2019a]
MDLSLLRDSLPSANLAQADRDLLDNFKAAALSITTLYKSARTNSKLNYNVGYAACLRDVLSFIQAGVSAEGRMAALGGNDGSGALGIQLNNGDGMTIGMVMDWLENRLETITSEDDDVEAQGTGVGGVVREDEVPKMEKTRERNVPATKRTSPRVAREMPPPPSRILSQVNTAATAVPPTQQPHVLRSARMLSSSPPSLPTANPRPPTAATPSTTRSRTKAERHRNSAQGSLSSTFTFNAPLPPSAVNPFERDFGSQHLSLSMDQCTDGTTPTSAAANENDYPLIMPELPQTIGSKRRHSTIISEISDQSTFSGNGGPSPTSGRNGGQASSGSNKKRNRGGPSALGAGRVLNESQDANAMDVEETSASGEPARKKVSRR